ncbi:L domain-like protein [Vararia minispora EC-137]|uniref:L domain-like protein n=1 Tax=Vararia minispora EC-137 TaxID=1314806 RepID=A0ACB8QQ64_9AGAM|nr:L domain-like protein [Vararia minispora EC-137]
MHDRTARLVFPGEQGHIDGAHPETDPEEEEGDEEFEAESGDPLADLPDDTEELDLVHARLSALDALCLERFGPYLRRLCLRQNFIMFLDPNVFHKLTKLEELDLYDNKLKGVGLALDAMSELAVLDLSFNLLKAVPENLDCLPSLKTVYFVQNRITKISGFANVGATLRSVELGGNRIRVIEGLDALVNLEELWLGKNKITQLENLSQLKRLKILALQSNRITKIEGLDALENLEELYLSHNGVQRLEGLQHNTKLTTLDVGNNFIPRLENVAHLSELTELWINNNRIETLHDLERELGPLPALATVYLEGNPAQRAEGANYRRKIQLALPRLTQIDATATRNAAI